MTSNRSSAEALKRFFHSPDEKLIAILGRGYIQSILTGRGISSGVLILTDQRLYQKGKRYNQTPAGGWSSSNASSVVSIGDITGTQFISENPTSLLVTAIIFGIIALVLTVSYIPLAFSFILPIILLVIYLKKID